MISAYSRFGSLGFITHWKVHGRGLIKMSHQRSQKRIQWLNFNISVYVEKYNMSHIIWLIIWLVMKFSRNHKMTLMCLVESWSRLMTRQVDPRMHEKYTPIFSFRIKLDNFDPQKIVKIKFSSKCDFNLSFYKEAQTKRVLN